MRWQSFTRRLTVARAFEVFIVPPQRRRPRARCAHCGHVLSLTHAWLMVWPLTREDWFRAAVATVRPAPGGCLLRRLRLHLVGSHSVGHRRARVGWGIRRRDDSIRSFSGLLHAPRFHPPSTARLALDADDTKCQS